MACLAESCKEGYGSKGIHANYYYYYFLIIPCYLLRIGPNSGLL
jgi:hypothetical protein